MFLVVSRVTSPSKRFTMRSAYEASRCEWVTMTIVVPSLFRRRNSSITSIPFLESRLPVGSSARIISGVLYYSLTIAIFRPSILRFV